MDVLKRNNVTVTGKGETPLLFAHGYGCDQKMWRYVWPAFEDDYKVVLFDHVGFGQSDDSGYTPKRYGSLHAYAQDILEIIDALQLKDVIFVGHSVSAMIGVLAAIKNPGAFQKLVLIGPSPRYINDKGYIGGFERKDIDGLLESLDSDYLTWAGNIAPVIMGNAENPELGQELASSFCNSNIDIAKNFAYLTFLSDNRQDLQKLRIPSLILQCQEDVIAPVEVGQYVYEHTPGSKLVMLNATGHCPNLSAPEETVKAIKDFLDTQNKALKE